jgi:hypothetical protein
MDKQQSTKHYTENNRSSNTNPTKTKTLKNWGNSGRVTVPAPLVKPVVLI